MTELRFEGKVAVITGGGGAIGQAHAAALGERGAHIVLIDYPVGPFGERDVGVDTRCEDAAQRLRSIGINVATLTADVTDDAQVRQAMAQVIRRHGAIDILICNAGTAETHDRIELAPAEGLESQFDIHVRGSLLCTRSVWPHMRSRGNGRILLTGSTACLGLRQEEGHYGAGYAVAKAALIGATRQLAGSGRDHGIAVNLLMPWAYSRLLAAAQSAESPIGNWMQRTMPADLVASAALFLLHEDCPASGEIFSAGGGRLARMVTAMPEGFVSADMSAEAVRDNWDRVMGAPADWIALSSFEDEWAILQRHLGSPFG